MYFYVLSVTSVLFSYEFYFISIGKLLLLNSMQGWIMNYYMWVRTKVNLSPLH